MFQRNAKPIFATRAVHLDLKGLPPTFERLMDWLDLFAALRFNAILVEWEDTFPWTVDETLRGRTFYTPSQVRSFADRAESLGLEIIPLVQSLGHLEHVLQHEAYRPLREVPARHDCINPLHEGSVPLIRSLIDDVLALLPGVRRFHIGGDEAYAFATNEQTAAFARQHGRETLYLHHVTPLLDHLSRRSIRPMIWHDMMMAWADEPLQNLASLADLVVWGYRGRPETTDHHHRAEILDRFASLDLPLWAAGAFKGADGHFATLPDYPARVDNGLGWADAAGRYSFRGIIATGWSRYSASMPQVEPLDATLDCLAAWALLSHDGQLPATGRDDVLTLLPDGARTRFEQSRSALVNFADALSECWRLGMVTTHAISELQTDPTRKAGGEMGHPLELMDQSLAEAQAVGETLADVLAASHERYWAEHFVRARHHAAERFRDSLNAALNRFSDQSK